MSKKNISIGYNNINTSKKSSIVENSKIDNDVFKTLDKIGKRIQNIEETIFKNLKDLKIDNVDRSIDFKNKKR
jgi:hypothetical protein